MVDQKSMGAMAAISIVLIVMFPASAIAYPDAPTAQDEVLSAPAFTPSVASAHSIATTHRGHYPIDLVEEVASAHSVAEIESSRARLKERPRIVWNRTYDKAPSDVALDVAVDSSGNVYVTGYAYYIGGLAYWLTIKYSPNGDVVWTKFGERGSSTGVAVDAQGYVYVVGDLWPGQGYEDWDYGIFKFNSSGTLIWVNYYDRGYREADFPNGVAVDSSGNAYVTGYSYYEGGFDYLTVKFTSDGGIGWGRIYDSGSKHDCGNAVAVDAQGNIYVVGVEWHYPDYDARTIKYSPSGDLLWTVVYDPPDVLDERAMGVAVDAQGYVYVTGDSTTLEGDHNYCTIKYTSSGDMIWDITYNRSYYDVATNVAVDAQGYVYVTGRSHNGMDSDYLTIKYDSNGKVVWVVIYNGGDLDWAFGVAVDAQGYVYVTGVSFVQNNDYRTIKYSQNSVSPVE